MSLGSDKLEYKVTANPTEFEKAMGRVMKTAETTAQKTGQVFKAGAVIGAAAIGGLTIAMTKAIEVANVQKEAEAKLGAVLQATGEAAGYNLDQLKKMAGGLQEVTTVGDETILSGMSLLATFKEIRGEGFERATKAALDMSTIMGTDLNSAMMQLGKALNDPAKGLTALTRSGISFTEQQKEQITTLQESGKMFEAQAVILAEVEKQVGGAATAMRGTFAGAVEAAKNAWFDLQEQIGFAVTENEAFVGVAGRAEALFVSWAKSVEENRDTIAKLFDGVLIAAELAVKAIAAVGTAWADLYNRSDAQAKGLPLADALTMSSAQIEQWLDNYKDGISQLEIKLKSVSDEITQIAKVRDFEKGEGVFSSWTDAAEANYQALVKEKSAIIEQIETTRVSVVARQKAAIADQERADAAAAAAKQIVAGSKAEVQANDNIAASKKEVIKLTKDAQWEVLALQKAELQAWNDSQRLTNQKIAAMNGIQQAEKAQTDTFVRLEQLKKETTEEVVVERSRLEQGFHRLSMDATTSLTNAFIRGENAKEAVAQTVSNHLTGYAVQMATQGLEAILTGKGAEIGAWAAAGTAASGTEGSNWVQRVAAAGAYVLGAGAAILAGKALGDTFHARGGWIGSNPNGGVINQGSGVADDVFLGFTDGGATRNWGMGGEFVINKESTAKHYPLLKKINDDNFAEGGPVTNAWPLTRGINDAGFDTFLTHIIESQGDWRGAIAKAVLYYGGTGGAMLLGKAIGPKVMGYASGGVVGDRKFLFGGLFDDVLDPGGVFHKPKNSIVGDSVGWVDPGSSAVWNSFAPLFGGQQFDGPLTGVIGGTVGKEIWKAVRKLPIIDEYAKIADNILYPFVRDTVTPGVWPNLNTSVDMLKGTLANLGQSIVTAVTAGFGSNAEWGIGSLFRRDGGLLGSYASGTDYVPRTGAYMLHQGERVTPAREARSEMSELKQIMVAVAKYSKKTASALDRIEHIGLPVSSRSAVQ